MQLGQLKNVVARGLLILGYLLCLIITGCSCESTSPEPYELNIFSGPTRNITKVYGLNMGKLIEAAGEVSGPVSKFDVYLDPSKDSCTFILVDNNMHSDTLTYIYQRAVTYENAYCGFQLTYSIISYRSSIPLSAFSGFFFITLP